MSVNDLSFDNFLQFLDWTAQKGKIKSSTVSALKVASNKVLGVLENEEKKDLSKIDLDEVFDRFKNLNAHKFSPESLRVYKSRTNNALNDFFSYQQSPENWKPSISQRSRQTKAKNNQRYERTTSNVPNQIDRDSQGTSQKQETSSLSHSFPLRSDVIVKIDGLPLDFKQSEAKRLSAFLLALCEDYQPGN